MLHVSDCKDSILIHNSHLIIHNFILFCKSVAEMLTLHDNIDCYLFLVIPHRFAAANILLCLCYF